MSDGYLEEAIKRCKLPIKVDYYDGEFFICNYKKGTGWIGASTKVAKSEYLYLVQKEQSK